MQAVTGCVLPAAEARARLHMAGHLPADSEAHKKIAPPALVGNGLQALKMPSPQLPSSAPGPCAHCWAAPARAPRRARSAAPTDGAPRACAGRRQPCPPGRLSNISSAADARDGRARPGARRAPLGHARARALPRGRPAGRAGGAGRRAGRGRGGRAEHVGRGAAPRGAQGPRRRARAGARAADAAATAPPRRAPASGLSARSSAGGRALGRLDAPVIAQCRGRWGAPHGVEDTFKPAGGAHSRASLPSLGACLRTRCARVTARSWGARL